MPAIPKAVPPQSSPFAQILAAVVGRIAAGLGIDAAYVRPVASDDYKVTVLEDLFVYVRPYPPRPDPEGGAGRFARNVSRFLRCYLYTRQGTDEYGGDETALMGTDPKALYSATSGGGHLWAEEILFNVLDDFSPIVSGVCLTVGPVRPTTSNTAPERDPENEAGLVRSRLDFEAVYVVAQRPVEPNV